MTNLTRKLLVVKELAFGSELSLLGRPVIITHVDHYTELTKRLEAGQLYDISKTSIKPFAQSSEVVESMSKRKRIKLLEKIAGSAGWGDVKVEKIEEDPLSVEVHLKGSVIARELEEEGKVDHAFRGSVVGALEELYGGELVGIETECIADGDEKCVVEVKPRDEFDSEVLEEYSDQLP